MQVVGEQYESRETILQCIDINDLSTNFHICRQLPVVYCNFSKYVKKALHEEELRGALYDGARADSFGWPPRRHSFRP